MNKRIWFYVVLLVLIDQFTKWIFYDLKYFQESFFIQAVLNKGISWGIDWFPDFFVMLITGIFIAFLIYYWRKGLVADKVFVLLLAGAIGNLIDRIFWGGVRDFIDFHFWPIFNLADVYLSFGVMIWIWQNLTKG